MTSSHASHRMHLAPTKSPGLSACSLAVAAGALVLASAACRSPQSFERDADSQVAEILGNGTSGTLGRRAASVEYPKKRAVEPVAPVGDVLDDAPAPAAENPLADPALDTTQPPAAPPPDQPTPPSTPPSTPPGANAQAPAATVAPRVLSLHEALDIAIHSNRDYISRKEALYLNALGLSGTRHAFGPLLTALLSYIFTDSDSTNRTHGASLIAGLSQILPTGGDLRLSGATNFGDDGNVIVGPRRTFSSALGIQLTQPLLRGAGYEASHEALTQAERDLIYTIREFELFREGFSIDVASRYYNLVQQKRSVENERRNMESVVFGRRQAEALFSVGRASELDMLRARRTELTSRNRMIEVEENYRLSLDQFRIFLGLPPSDLVEVQPEEPAFVEIDYDVASAIEVALKNRLDFLNRKEQLEDSERSVRIAENGLLPAMSLDASYDLTSDASPGFTNQTLADNAYRVGVTLELPVDRLLARNSYRSATIAHRRALRSFEEFEDTLVVNVQSTFRTLERHKESLAIQRQLISDQEKNLAIAQIRFERGELSNRDVDEARQALLDAKNSLIQEQVSYEIARLQLMRDLGILFIDEQGMWQE